VQHEVFEMDEFAVDPQRGDGIAEILPFEKAVAQGRSRDALVECGFYFRVSNRKLSYRR